MKNAWLFLGPFALLFLPIFGVGWGALQEPQSREQKKRSTCAKSDDGVRVLEPPVAMRHGQIGRSLSERSSPQAVDARSEAALSEQLHLAGLTQPARLLTVARSALESFPNSPKAAYWSWLEARALVELGRFQEAKQVAVRMKREHPDTNWTGDVARHLLTHPLENDPETR